MRILYDLTQWLEYDLTQWLESGVFHL
jgi:hypothetical protein